MMMASSQPARATVTILGGTASAGADMGASTNYPAPPTKFTRNAIYQEVPLTNHLSGQTDNWHGWAGISWALSGGTTGHYHADASSKEGFNGAVGTGGHVYGLGHASITIEFALDGSYVYEATANVVAGRTIAPGKGALAAGVHTFTATCLGMEGGFSFDIKLTPLPMSFADVLRGQLRVQPDGATMRASFTPGGGLSLRQAAELGGFDHFNWVQRVTHLPAGWQLELVDGTGALVGRAEVNADGSIAWPFLVAPDGQTTGIELLDPPADPGASGRHYRVTTPAGTAHDVPVSDGYIDSSDGMLGEDPGRAALPGNRLYPGGDVAGVYVPPFTTDRSIRFEDTPSLGPDAAPDAFFGFQTRLVGVSATGAVVPLPEGLGLTFHWHTDARTAVVDSQFVVLRDGNLPPISAGGVFGITVDIPAALVQATSEARVVQCAADPNHYYVLYRGETVTDLTKPVAVALTSGTVVSLVDPSPAAEAGYYRIGIVSKDSPLDLDGDGVDDLQELTRGTDPLSRPGLR